MAIKTLVTTKNNLQSEGHIFNPFSAGVVGRLLPVKCQRCERPLTPLSAEPADPVYPSQCHDSENFRPNLLEIPKVDVWIEFSPMYVHIGQGKCIRKRQAWKYWLKWYQSHAHTLSVT